MLEAVQVISGFTIGLLTYIVGIAVSGRTKMKGSIGWAISPAMTLAAVAVLAFFPTDASGPWTAGGVIASGIGLELLARTYGKRFFTQFWEQAAEPLKKWANELGDYDDRTRSLRPPKEGELLSCLEDHSNSLDPQDESQKLSFAILAEKVLSTHSFGWFCWNQYTEMKKQLESAQVPELATKEVRERIREQLAVAEELQTQAMKRTKLFQVLGSIVIVVGLLIVVSAVVASFLNILERLQVGFMAVGVFVNLIGALLISFHRTASRLSLAYYDRRQRLFDQQTALELATKDFLDQKSQVTADIIRTLVAPPRKEHEDT